MSKIQTKLNFLEKKKTSARLQEKFKKNELEQNQVKDKNSKSLNNCKAFDVGDKENELKSKLLPRKNPTVLIYRSPKKLLETKSVINSNNECITLNLDLEQEMPSNKEISRKNNVFKNNENERLKTDDNQSKELSLQDTPTKKNLYSPFKENGKINCKSPSSMSKLISPKKIFEERKEMNSSRFTKKMSNSPRKENNEFCKLSPLKRGAVSPEKNTNRGEGSSPPKQKCLQEETPSQLMTRLALDSAEKPSLRTRKELFPKGEFDEACKALNNTAPTNLPGREDKLEFIKDFLIKHSEEQSSGTLYISGPPGTGKTASVNITISEPQVSEMYKVVCMNCTTFNTCGSVYNRLLDEFKLKVQGNSEKAALKAIEKHLDSKKRKMILIILDELDQLCSAKQSVLYSLFEWPSRPNARLVLIGIANALDLTDRVLPRLQVHLEVQPTILHFPSYSRQQITEIITDRLSQAGVEQVFSGATLQLLAGKVAAVNGDVRRALDIARRVVELAEKRTVLQPICNNGSPKETVALQEVMSVINDVYNTALTLDSSQTSSFPLQQKFLICSLLLIRQTSKAKDITIGKLHEVYKKVCERRNMSSLDMSEFISLTTLVEARGIIKVNGKNYNRLSKVILQWDEKEVKSALCDKQLLAAVLMDKGVVT